MNTVRIKGIDRRNDNVIFDREYPIEVVSRVLSVIDTINTTAEWTWILPVIEGKGTPFVVPLGGVKFWSAPEVA